MRHTLQCAACGNSQESVARPGKTVACSQCQAPIKIPFERGAGVATAFDCPACGQGISTTSKAGKKMKCRSCQAEVRVPFPEEAEAAGVLMACSACEREVRIAARPGKHGRCPECGEKVRVPLSEVPSTVSSGSDIKQRQYSKRPTRGLDRDRGSLQERWKVRRMPPGLALLAGLIAAAAGPLLTLILSQFFYGGLVFAPLALIPFGLALAIDGILRLRKSSAA